MMLEINAVMKLMSVRDFLKLFLFFEALKGISLGYGLAAGRLFA